jgi:putative peptidoglycan lipid II flippase
MFPHSFSLPKLFNSQGQWLEKQQTSILSAAAIITIANIISAGSGFIRERVMLGIFYTDATQSKEAYTAFKLAFQIPDILFQLIILGALSAAFIPVFTSIRKKSEKDALVMASIVLNILLVLFVIMGIGVFIFAEPITQLRTGAEFTSHQLEIATNLTKIMLFGQLFFALSNLLGAFLQSYQRFIIPSIAPIFYNIGILIGVYFFSSTYGIYSAGIGVVIGAFLHMALHLPLSLKLGYRFIFSLNIFHPGVKELLLIAPARVLTIAVNQLETLGMGYFLTTVGSVSFLLFTLAQSVIAIPIRFFSIPISQAALSFLSKESANKELDRFKELVTQSLNQISFLTMPAAVLVLILRVPIVRFLFGTNDFPWSDTVTTGKIVAILALSIAAQAMSQLLTRAFYSLKDTRTPLLITLCTVTFYVGSTFLVITQTTFGVLGIATTMAVTEICKTFLLIGFFDHKLQGAFAKKFWLPQFKILAAAFLMAIFLYLPFRILDQLVFDTSRTIELIGLSAVTATIGSLVYIYFAALFDIQELRLLSTALASLRISSKHLPATQEVFADSSGENTNV